MCPHCALSLTVVDRDGIEIDFCEKCHGVWLDKHELDKIIERGAPAQNDGNYSQDTLDTFSNDGDRNPLADIFDFFGGSN